MNLNRIGKFAALAFGVWAMWVAYEWRNTFREITSAQVTGAPHLMGERSTTLASLGAPLQLPTRLPPEGQKVAIPVVDPMPNLEVPSNLAVTSNEAAEKYLAEKRREWGVREYHELRAQTYESPLGTKVKYSAFQDGLPIIGSEITLDVTKDTKDVSVADNSYVPLKKVNTQAKTLSYDMILEKNPSGYKMDLTVATGVSKVLYVPPGSDEPELSYVMAVKENGTGPTESLVFRASDGMVLGRQTPRSEF